MKVSEKVQYKVDRLQKGYIFTYSDLDIGVESKEAVLKALNRMVETGTLKKLSKGRYYKPEITPFGELLPDQNQVVKDILDDKGYLTGTSIFNQLGLTTQVSNTIQIGKNDWRPSFKREPYIIKFIRQKNKITRENIPLLQILDSIRMIKSIPDTDQVNTSHRFISILKNLEDNNIRNMTKLAEKYPASTRALLGFYLEKAGKNEFIHSLRKSINPITRYKYPEIATKFPSAGNWNIT